MLCPNPVGRGTGNIIVDYKCGTRACFDCPSGSVISGDPNITCLEDGTWSGPIPTCVASSEPHTGAAARIREFVRQTTELEASPATYICSHPLHTHLMY